MWGVAGRCLESGCPAGWVVEKLGASLKNWLRALERGRGSSPF